MEKPSLGEVGFRRFWQHMTAIDPTWNRQGVRIHDWSELSDPTRASWTEAAAAVVMEYDARLFADAEQRAIALGLEPASAGVPQPARPEDA